jgi:hypothetical protein
MLRLAWTSLLIAIASGLVGFGPAAGPALAPLQFATFLFGVLFFILLILGSPSLKNLI